MPGEIFSRGILPAANELAVREIPEPGLGMPPPPTARRPLPQRPALVDELLAQQLGKFQELEHAGTGARMFGGIAEQERIIKALPLLLKLQEQHQQFIVNKQLAVGTLAMTFLEKMATAKPEARAALAGLGDEFLKPLLDEVGINLPTNLLKSLSETPGLSSKYGALITSQFGQTRGAAILEQMATLEPKDIPTFLEKEFERGLKGSQATVQQTMAAWTRRIRGDPGLATRVGIPLDPEGRVGMIPPQLFADSADTLFTDPLDKIAAAKILTDTAFAPYLLSIGIQPGQVDLKAMEAFRTELAKERTPGGQARVALTKEQTLKEGVLVLPQGGSAALTLPGSAASKAIPGATQGLSPEGIQTAPGVGVIGQSALPGIPLKEAEKITAAEKGIQALERIGAMRADRSLDAYIGPRTSRPVGATTEFLQKFAPSELAGELPPDVVRLQQALAELRNFIIPKVTGATVRKDEEPQIMAELPSITLDKPGVFWQKYDQSVATLKAITQREKALIGPGGRLKIGAEAEAALAQHPLPSPLGLRATPASPLRRGAPQATGR